MRIPILVAVLGAACGGGGSPGAGDGPPGAGDGPPTSDGPVTRDAPLHDDASLGDGLRIVGNHIQLANGQPFHGRGANLHDERSCEACAFAPPQPAGLDRWADELIDTWHASFIRFLLSAKGAPASGEIQWQDLVDDPAYLADSVMTVHHMTSKGAYVLVTLFADDTMKPENGDPDSEWPSSAGDSTTRYTALATALASDSHVLFGLTNEPHGPAARDADLAAVYTHAIAAIRAVEDARGVPHHVVVVQAPEGYARDLSYFLAHPLAGDQIAYEVHPYNPQTDFDALVVQPAKTLPILIGEYGPAGSMTPADIQALWTVAEANGVPYIAWNFHHRCPPNLLMDTATDGCGLDPSLRYAFPRTAWGDLLFAHLQTPW